MLIKHIMFWFYKFLFKTNEKAIARCSSELMKRATPEQKAILHKQMTLTRYISDLLKSNQWDRLRMEIGDLKDESERIAQEIRNCSNDLMK